MASNGTPTKLVLDDADYCLLLCHFKSDSDFAMCKDKCFVDCKTASLVWISEMGDESLNAEVLEAIASDSRRYIEIESMNHGDHHSALSAFLDSDWTNDEKLKAKAIQAYKPVSIGYWKEQMGADAWNEFESFCEGHIDELLHAQLRKLGFDLVVK